MELVFFNGGRKGKKLVAVFCVIMILFILTQLFGYVEKCHPPQFATPQEVAEYVYNGEVQAIIPGTNSYLIFHDITEGTVDFMISSCLDGMYKTVSEMQSNLIVGKSDMLGDIIFLQEKSSDDQYVEIVGTGCIDKLSVYDSIGTTFFVSFDERMKSDKPFAFFVAVGYLDRKRFGSDTYTVTVESAGVTERLTMRRQRDGSFVLTD